MAWATLGDGRHIFFGDKDEFPGKINDRRRSKLVSQAKSAAKGAGYKVRDTKRGTNDRHLNFTHPNGHKFSVWFPKDGRVNTYHVGSGTRVPADEADLADAVTGMNKGFNFSTHGVRKGQEAMFALKAEHIAARLVERGRRRVREGWVTFGGHRFLINDDEKAKKVSNRMKNEPGYGHSMRIAAQTLHMPAPIAGVMGGPSQDSAREQLAGEGVSMIKNPQGHLVDISSSGKQHWPGPGGQYGPGGTSGVMNPKAPSTRPEGTRWQDMPGRTGLKGLPGSKQA